MAKKLGQAGPGASKTEGCSHEDCNKHLISTIFLEGNYLILAQALSYFVTGSV